MLFSGIYLVKPYRILIYERGGADDLYYALRKREGDVEDFILNNLKPGDTFIDVEALEKLEKGKIAISFVKNAD
jgi:hypothetical protein